VSDKAMPPASTLLNPVLKEKHHAVTGWLQNDPTDSHLDSAMAQLTHLEVFPTTLDTSGQAWAPPAIISVRSHVPSASSPYQEVQSIVDRWDIINEQDQNMHSAFEQLGSGRNSQATEPPVRDPYLPPRFIPALADQSQPNTRLKKLESIIFNKVIVGIHTSQFGKVLCIAFSDGSVEYRDRFTMNEVYHELSLDRVMTLNQVGFTFAEETPCKHFPLPPPW
jgi:mediator of RNA polymerase II transcription subunit 16, fungi type